MTNDLRVIEYSQMLSLLEQNQAEVEKQRAKLTIELQELSNIAKLLSEIIVFMDRGWHLHILEAIKKNQNLLNENKSNIFQQLENIKLIATEESQKMKPHLFPRYIQESCQKAGIKIDSNSAHPIYRFKQSFFEVKVDDAQQRFRLSNYESSKVIDSPADIPAIIYYLQQEEKRIFSRSFDAKTFLKKIRTEYLAIIKKNKLSDGSSVLIRSIMQNLRKKGEKFCSDEFLIDLSRLVQEGYGEINGRKFELQQTKDTKEGMLLHGTLSPTYVGFIIFKPV